MRRRLLSDPLERDTLRFWLTSLVVFLAAQTLIINFAPDDWWLVSLGAWLGFGLGNGLAYGRGLRHGRIIWQPLADEAIANWRLASENYMRIFHENIQLRIKLQQQSEDDG